ncbi:hypothetical protein BDR03DRAFT_1003748 [Suillus americanus]|nr:hypothetical protein BDR03DRAFT_1003748 [Suillus americanus]
MHQGRSSRLKRPDCSKSLRDVPCISSLNASIADLMRGYINLYRHHGMGSKRLGTVSVDGTSEFPDACSPVRAFHISQLRYFQLYRISSGMRALGIPIPISLCNHQLRVRWNLADDDSVLLSAKNSRTRSYDMVQLKQQRLQALRKDRESSRNYLARFFPAAPPWQAYRRHIETLAKARGQSYQMPSGVGLKDTKGRTAEVGRKRKREN